MRKQVLLISTSLLIISLTSACFSNYLPISSLSAPGICTGNTLKLYLDQDNNKDSYKDRAFYLADNIKFDYTKTGKDIMRCKSFKMTTQQINIIALFIIIQVNLE